MIFCQIPLWKFMEASLENFYVDEKIEEKKNIK